MWGTNTNVDFERALAGAINKVREALGDSAENPRFIETLTKRGYRFIAPITPLVLPVVSAATQVEVSAGTEGHAAFPAALEVLSGGLAPVPGQKRDLVLPGRTNHFLLDLTKREIAFASAALLATISAATFVFLAGRHVAPPPVRVEQLTHYSPISIGPPNMESLLTLATDGDRVITSVINDGIPRLSAIYPDTGLVQPLTMPSELASNSLADISRDGSKLLLRSHLSSESEQALWVVPSAGGSALRVGNVLAHDAAWMPDGESILYANGNDLSLIRLDNGVTTSYAAHLAGRAFWLRWSPNGKLLRFTLMDPVSHTSSIWEPASDSRVARPLPETAIDGRSVACGTWTADGSAFVFQASDNKTGDLWELLGSGINAIRVQLTNGPLRYLSPVAARSGSRIFFMGLNGPSGLQQFVSAKGDFEPVPAFLADASRVDYSRDANWVAWTDNEGRLWRARAADGSEKLQLTPGWLEVFSGHWSPDGRSIAVMARSRGGVWQIYSVDATGGTPQMLLHEGRNQADPDWSADGRSIVFGREPDLMGKEPGPRNIQVLSLTPRAVETLPDSDGLFSPRWSPDGRWIAALSADQKSIKLFDTTERRWTDLAITSAADPVWSSDSKSIYVHAFLADREPILKISVPDGTSHVVADLTNFQNGANTNYFFGGMTPANAPLVQPRIGTGNLYTLDLDRH